MSPDAALPENLLAALKPTLRPAELDMLNAYASKAKGIFEYGCGHSTAGFVDLGVPRIVSVDSDPAWIERLRQIPSLVKAEEDRRLTFIHADIGPVGDWGKPRNRKSKARWPAYVLAPWTQGPKFSPDMVFVDGRFRVACILTAFLFGRPKLKVVVHDFWDRDYYHKALQFASVVDKAERLAVLEPARDIRMSAMAKVLRPAFDQML
ncbi:hypothetical protein KHC28_00015 [Ancylobacter sonchi]|uniref:hypothetical protein n=1 Tax=Ancylobacter sonchi TaxID=1937790 RepID=UPI001BD32C2E|nr:hypothetical protein [Ancylobacter sonchi]MBS7532055.1 hypothetical protein [Ancylobacter sonchi]